MKKQAGLWIDHRKAVIVIVTEAGEEVKEITSGMEKRIRFTDGTGSEEGSAEDMRDRQFDNHLDSYYDRVVSIIRGAETIQIFGPGEAKGELKKRFEQEGMKSHILAVETVDKMTDRQISAKVHERFSG
ncbi:MAG TPA: hypothetical protein VMT91_11975 [Anaerolineales bacterium]|nr:hypothetical protein [Anaerolineales bacterium]